MKKLFAFFALALFVFGCDSIGTQTGEGGEESTLTPPAPPTSVQLEFAEKPVLQKPVDLVLTAETTLENDSMRLRIAVPDGFEFVAGDTLWTGSLTQDQKVQVTATVKSMRMGYYEVRGGVAASKPSSKFGNKDEVYVEVAKDDAILGSKPENNWEIDSASGYLIPAPACFQGKVESSFSLSQTPKLGKEFTATYRVVFLKKLESSRLQLDLLYPKRGVKLRGAFYPEGGNRRQYNQGFRQLSWLGPVPQKGDTLTMSAKFEVTKSGWGHMAGAVGASNPHLKEVQAAELYVDQYTGRYKMDEQQPMSETVENYECN